MSKDAEPRGWDNPVVAPNREGVSAAVAPEIFWHAAERQEGSYPVDGKTQIVVMGEPSEGLTALHVLPLPLPRVLQQSFWTICFAITLLIDSYLGAVCHFSRNNLFPIISFE